MYGICGWVGAIADPWRSGALLGGMLSDCGATPGPDHPAAFEPDACFGALGGGPSCLFADGDLVVAVTEVLRGASGREVTAEDLADLYRSHGTNFLRRVRGVFSVALFDRRTRNLVLAVDRAGIRPLYLWRKGGVTAFASRLAALRRMPGFEPLIDSQAVFNYLYFHVVPSPGTIYRDCEKLLPAQMRTLGEGRQSETFYWSMPYRDDNPASFEDLRDEFRALLPRVVERAAGPADSAGAFLSGEMDSWAVAGMFQRGRNSPVRTYSAGFQAEGFDGIEYARAAARHFGTDAREYFVTPEDVLESIPEVAAYCDEPFANASIVSAYLCARSACREGDGRLLAGDGGNEVFGGSARFANPWLFECYGRLPRLVRSIVIEPVAFGFPWGDRIPPLRKVRSYIAEAKVPLPDRLETYNFLHRTPLRGIFDPGFLAEVDPEQPLDDLRDAYARARSESSVNRVMHVDLKATLADNELRKVNQACGLAGIDVRYPLLDDEMLEFAASVPPRMRVRRTRLGWFLGRALADFLPQNVIAKTKRRFELPVGRWMAEHEPLRELMRANLASLRARGILKAAYLDRVVDQHRGTHASDYGVVSWVAVMLEQWLEQHGH